MQENLLGYLLGALDCEEQADVQKRLEYDPQLREQLTEIESRLIPLEQERWQHEPPAGLAAATCKFIASTKTGTQTRPTGHEESSNAGLKIDHQVELEPAISARTAAKGARKQLRRDGVSHLSEWNPRKHGWDLIDAGVAAGIFAAAALLFFPAIANSRHEARLAACQNNLRLGNVGLSVFGERNNGVLPYIPTSGNTGVAGFYAPQLVEGGFLNEDSNFLCPSSQLAATDRGKFRVPTAAQIRKADGAELVELQQKMGGSYMYTLGHFRGGRHYATTSFGRNFFPVMADARLTANGEDVSSHGANGVNVAFEGGHVRYIVGLGQNHPFFVSDRGNIEAGSHLQDVVLGHSWARPQPLDCDGDSVETGVTEMQLLAPLKCDMLRPITSHVSATVLGE